MKSNSDRTQPITSSNLSFGLVFATFFMLIGLWPLIHGDGPRGWSIALSVIFALVALVVPSALSPLNLLWARFGQLLHSIVSPIALGLVFYCVVTPTGLIRRLLGKDPLRLKADRSQKSYWVIRTPPGPSAESLKNQF